MKQCSLDLFTESLRPWLDNNYIRSVSVDQKGLSPFSLWTALRTPMK